MTNQTLENRLQRIEDDRALGKLINHYHLTADRFDLEAWADTFTEDAVFEFAGAFGTLNGRQAIHDTIKATMVGVFEVQQHIIVNLDFAVDGDVATGTGDLIYVSMEDRSAPSNFYASGGRYRWSFTRTAEGWRISQAFLEFLWNNGTDNESVFTVDDRIAFATGSNKESE